MQMKPVQGDPTCGSWCGCVCVCMISAGKVKVDGRYNNSFVRTVGNASCERQKMAKPANQALDT